MRALPLVLACAWLTSAHAAAPEMFANDAWVPLAPPGATVHAGYLELRNAGAQPATLVAVRSPAFGAIELHETVMTDGAMSMRRLDSLVVPAHGSASLAPHGRHLMLFRAKRTLPAGTRVPLTLRFADGRELETTAEVRDPRTTAAPRR